MYSLTIWRLLCLIPCALVVAFILKLFFRHRKSYGAVISTSLVFQFIFYISVHLLTMDRAQTSYVLHLLTSSGLNLLGSGIILFLTMLIDENINY